MAVQEIQQPPGDVDAVKKQRFLEVYSRIGVITDACRQANVSHGTFYKWKREDPQFVQDFAYAEEQAGDLLEREARRRAVLGLTIPVLHQGQQVMVEKRDANGNLTGEKEPLWEKRYSDTLLIFLLKGAKPEKYRERHELTGAGGGPIRHEVTHKIDLGALVSHLTLDQLRVLEHMHATGLLGVGPNGGLPALAQGAAHPDQADQAIDVTEASGNGHAGKANGTGNGHDPDDGDDA